MIFYKLNADGQLVCRGAEVTALQTKLNYIGCTPKLVADGLCGKNTDAAIRWYQRRYSLTVDGIAGPDTLYSISVLYEALKFAAQVKKDGDWKYARNGSLANRLKTHKITCNDYVTHILHLSGYLPESVQTGHKTTGSKTPKNSDKLGNKLKVIDCGGKSPYALKLHTGDILVLNGKNNASTCIYVKDNGTVKNFGAQSNNQLHNKHTGSTTSIISGWWRRNGVTCVIRGK